MNGPQRVIGVMSGSSLDGIDLACCIFTESNGEWSFAVNEARTIPYPAAMRERLLHASSCSGLELARLHRDLGTLIGEACKDVVSGTPADLIASHGHTIFHQPDEGLTVQVGCGARIAAISGLRTVSDFRTMDVALGGQGAPLVPYGERMLFPAHNTFVNLGGISNIAVHRNGSSTGYDIGPCNQALNMLAEEVGMPYDADGAMTRKGTVDPLLLEKLDDLPFYKQALPRSLGREWFEVNMAPLLANRSIALEDRMRTTTEHLARMLANALAQAGSDRALFTGGGAHNSFLLERVRALCRTEIEVPSQELIDFKEAIIFAFLGLQRDLGRVNTLASVTGASRDSVGGAVHLPN